MSNSDRIERFSKIRGLLDYPDPQKPSPHQFLNQMLMTEQTFNLRLTNSRKSWNLISTTITTVAGTDVYAITQPVSLYQNSGKVHFVVRSTGNSDVPYLPIPYDDFSDRPYGIMPSTGQINAALAVPEKIAFYRANMQNQTINAVLSPMPQEVLTYTVWFFVGHMDRAQALLAGKGPLTELSDYLDLKTSRDLLDLCEWREDPNYNAMKMKNRMATILGQLAELEPIVDEYIKSINGPKTFEMDYWNDGD